MTFGTGREFVLAPAGSGGTHVRYALHSDVAGILGGFASNSSLRDKRRAKVRRDLQDLLRRFPGASPVRQVKAQAGHSPH